ncbi:unnamed protein product [Urochloa humidicola]
MEDMAATPPSRSNVPATWRPQLMVRHHREDVAVFQDPPMPVVAAGMQIPSAWNQGIGDSTDATKVSKPVWNPLRVEIAEGWCIVGWEKYCKPRFR